MSWKFFPEQSLIDVAQVQLAFASGVRPDTDRLLVDARTTAAKQFEAHPTVARASELQRQAGESLAAAALADAKVAELLAQRRRLELEVPPNLGQRLITLDREHATHSGAAATARQQHRAIADLAKAAAAELPAVRRAIEEPVARATFQELAARRKALFAEIEAAVGPHLTELAALTAALFKTEHGRGLLSAPAPSPLVQRAD